MTTWSRICRICSCTADYDVFDIIPLYLHAGTNEYLSWQKPINLLIEEATGLKVSKDDGLPENICALCISYLKHAINFREQTINNALNLKSITLQRSQVIEDVRSSDNNESQNVDKASVLVTANDLARAPDRETDISKLLSNYNQPEHNKVKKKLLNNNLPEPYERGAGVGVVAGAVAGAGVGVGTTGNVGAGAGASASSTNANANANTSNVLHGNMDPQSSSGYYAYNKAPKKGSNCCYDLLESANDCNKSNMLGEDDFNTTTTSGEDSEDTNLMQCKTNFFSYAERNFEEDDILDLDELRGSVTINIPETCKERKCRACFRRFMFEDSYNEHLNSCIELKLINFIEEINRLLEIRRSKSASPHEFIRRMIFSLRKICDWLRQNCVDVLLFGLVTNGPETRPRKHLGSETRSLSPLDRCSKANPNNTTLVKPNTLSPTSSNQIILHKENSKHVDLLDTTMNSTFETIKMEPSGSGTPINMSNNILYEIERSESRQKYLSQQHQQQQKQQQQHLQNQSSPLNLLQNDTVQKPIALLPAISAKSPIAFPSSSNKRETESTNLLIKLEKAAKKCANLEAAQAKKNESPNLAVAMTPKSTIQRYPASPSSAVTFSARCNPCNMTFETLATLEYHNALKHNKAVHSPKIIPRDTNQRDGEAQLAAFVAAQTQTQAQVQAEALAKAKAQAEADQKERQRIIALFEESSAEED